MNPMKRIKKLDQTVFSKFQLLFNIIYTIQEILTYKKYYSK